MEEKSAIKKFSFGGGQYDRQSPPREKLSSETPILNIELSLDEAGCPRLPPLTLSLKTIEGVGFDDLPHTSVRPHQFAVEIETPA